ncbi:hypothetical protein [Taklimakanibacter deserti]|uniref:hypothetical protein n=1 Tax=Taklimakanibacter deserti TaxID=2267839 RepID=UPI000E656042
MSTTPDHPPGPSGQQEPVETGLSRISLGKIIGGTAALAVLTVMGTYIFGGFNGLSAGGAMALILGVTLSYALGVGLMVAIFHSNRFYDESAHHAALDHFKDRHKDI